MILEYSYMVNYGYKTDKIATTFYYDYETNYEKFTTNHVENMTDDLLEFHVDVYEASTLDNEPLGRKLGVCKIKWDLDLEFDSDYEPKLTITNKEIDFDFEEEKFKEYFYDKNGDLNDLITDDMDNLSYALFKTHYEDLVDDISECYYEWRK